MLEQIQRALPRAAALGVFLLLVLTGLWGIDFGRHWDEKTQFDLVISSLKSGVFLPGWYKYPSVTYWLTLVGLFRYLILALSHAGGDWHIIQEHLLSVADTPAYHLQVRAVFLIVSALAVLWTYWQVVAQGRSKWEGGLAAAFLGLSWEVAYHARWIAPDTVLMQFGALALLLSTWAVRHPGETRWIRWAAGAAGLACGTKYPGGLLLLPVLIAAYHGQGRKERG